MAYQIQLRSDTANNWTTVNPILAQGEPGYENDTGNIKYGDGTTSWSSLPYFAASGGAGDYGNANVQSYLASGAIGNIIPSGNNIQSLGNATNQWKDLWISNNTIYINSIPISLTSNNDLTVAGNAVVTASGANGATNVTTLEVSGNLTANTITSSGNITAVNVDASGNVTAAYFIGDGSQLSNLNLANAVGGYGNANVALYLPTNTANIQGGEIVAVANVTAQYFVGDGSLLTGLPDTYANANVAAYLPTNTANIQADAMLATGNVTASYFIGDGSLLTNIPPGYTDADVAAFLPTYTGVLAGASLAVTGNVDAGNVNSADQIVAVGNITGGNLLTTGIISSVGNIRSSGSLFVNGNVDADGITVDGGVTAGGDISGNDFNASGMISAAGTVTGGDIATSGNITAVGDISGNDFNASGNVSAIGNVIGGNLVTTGNIFGGNVFSSGNLTGANISTAGTVYGGNISTTGTVTSNTSVTNFSSVTGNIEVAGDFTVAGNLTYTNVTNLQVDDPLIYAGANNVTNIVDQGLITPFNNGTQQYGGFVRDHTTGAWIAFSNVITAPTTTVDFTNAIYSNIQGGYLLGNISQATGLANVAYTGDYNDLNNLPVIPTATSNLINDSGFITANTSGNISATGNISAENFFAQGNVIALGGASFDNTLEAGNLATTGRVSATGNVTGLNITTGGMVVANGNISGSSFAASGSISAVGNVSGAGITASGSITSAGNITGSYFIGDGSQLTGITSDYGNANVATYLPVNTANVGAGNITVGGVVSAVGNITGSYILGNGSLLTGLPVQYSNANVASYLPVYNGNVSASYFIGDGSLLTGLPASYSNANVAAYLPTYTGNISAGYYTGNGSLLTGLYSNADVAAYLPTYSGNITANNILANTLSVTGNTSIAGNLTVSGNTTYTNVTNLEVDQPLIYAGANNVTNIVDQGLITPFNNGTQQFGGFVRDHTSGNWVLFSNVTAQPNTTVDFTNAVYDTLQAGAYIGDGGYLSNINAANITGAYGNSNVADYLPTYTGNIAAGNANIADSLSVTGTAYLYNISSAGSASLTIANVSGNIAAGGILTDNYYYANGVPVSFSGGSTYSNANVAAYLPTYSGDIGANVVTANTFIGNGALLTGLPAGYANSNVADYLPTYTGNITAAEISTTGNITGYYLLGNGALLTGLPVQYSNANVSAYLPTNTSNISAPFFTGNGSLLTGIESTYSNANVATYLPTYAGNIGANNINVSYEVNAGNVSSAGIVSAVGNVYGADITATGNITSGNISTGIVAATGNITSGNISTGIVAAAGNVSGSNVTTSGILSASGNVYGNNLVSSGIIEAAGNISGGNIISNALVIGTTLSATGDVLAGNVTAANTVTANTFIGVTLSITGNASIAGDLTVAGNTYSTSVTNVNVANAIMYLAANNVSDVVDIGTLGSFNNGTQQYGGIVRDHTDGVWKVVSNILTTPTTVVDFGNTTPADLQTGNIDAIGNVTANYFIGDGSLLTGGYGNTEVANYLPINTSDIAANTVTVSNSVIVSNSVSATIFYGDGSQLTGGYGNLNVGFYLPTYTGNLAAGNITTSGKVSVAGNVTGGNVFTIGQVSATGNVSGAYIIGNGALLTGLPAQYSNANVSTYLPVNTANVAAGNVIVTGAVSAANITTAGSVSATGNVTGGNIITAGNVSATGNVSANYFVGNGSLLTGIDQSVYVTSTVNSLQAGAPLLFSIDMANTQYPGGVFTLYQPPGGVAVTVSDTWATTGNISKNQYTDFANNVVNTSNISLVLNSIGGTFSVQASDTITIGPSVITGAALTGLGISGTGGTYNINAANIAANIQTALSTPVSVNLTVTNGNTTGAVSATGSTINTIAPVPFSFSNVTGSWPNAYTVANSDQQLSWTASGFNGTVVAGNVTLSGSSNITLSTSTATSGTSANIASNVGPYNITAIFTGTGLNGAGNTSVTHTTTVTPATYITPLYYKTTSSSANPNFTVADSHYTTPFTPLPLAPPNPPAGAQGATTTSTSTDYTWLALPGGSGTWTWPNDIPASNSPNIYFQYDSPPFTGVFLIPAVVFNDQTIAGELYTVVGFTGASQPVFIYCDQQV